MFNIEKLNQVLSDFYSSTGIAVALYDGAERTVAASSVYCGCCAMIRTKKECVKKCSCSDLEHMKEAALCQKTVRYTCHAGMMETVMPIVYEGVPIAYLQIGQFRDAEMKYSSEQRMEETAAQYGLDGDRLLSLYRDTQLLSEEKLSSVCNILEILIKSFWVDGLISYNRSMLSVKIEQYIKERLNEKIYIDELCNRFYLSKNALYQLFADEFKSTVNDFIMQKRMELAREMLDSRRELNVTQISSACGFPDYNYFIRAFKKHFGITPLQYRKRV